jgi:transcriptional regulator with PAS, ATPase and Fis domain
MNEIGDMSLVLQGKLLRALEEKTFRRVGGTTDLRVNVRVIAATNQNLKELMQGKKFREDLYYRLNTLTISAPSLRERPEDILPLAEHFNRYFSVLFEKEKLAIPAGVLQRLKCYAWPGNVRELRNAIERMCVFSAPGKGACLEHLPEEIAAGISRAGAVPGASPIPPLLEAVSETESRIIRNALRETQGNHRSAARLLRVTPKTLRRKLKKYRLSPSASLPPASAKSSSAL